MYGATPATYERLTGIPGSYAHCRRGIDLLIERGLPLNLKTVVTTLNQHEVWAMKRLAEEELGVGFKFDGMLNARIDCSHSPLAVRVQPWELAALDLQDAPRAAEWRQLAQRTAAASAQTSDELYHCGGGVTSFAIDPYGQLSICVLSHRDTYDLRSGSFREGWESVLRQARGKRRTRPTKCVTCGLKALCSMCPANGELEHGDPEAPVDYFCEVTHLRAYALGLTVPAHGSCAFCAGGAREAEVREVAARLQQGLPVSPMAGAVDLLALPVLQEVSLAGCGSGGCAACQLAAPPQLSNPMWTDGGEWTTTLPGEET